MSTDLSVVDEELFVDTVSLTLNNENSIERDFSVYERRLGDENDSSDDENCSNSINFVGETFLETENELENEMDENEENNYLPLVDNDEFGEFFEATDEINYSKFDGIEEVKDSSGSNDTDEVFISIERSTNTNTTRYLSVPPLSQGIILNIYFLIIIYCNLDKIDKIKQVMSNIRLTARPILGM